MLREAHKKQGLCSGNGCDGLDVDFGGLRRNFMWEMGKGFLGQGNSMDKDTEARNCTAR